MDNKVFSYHLCTVQLYKKNNSLINTCLKFQTSLISKYFGTLKSFYEGNVKWRRRTIFCVLFQWCWYRYRAGLRSKYPWTVITPVAAINLHDLVSLKLMGEVLGRGNVKGGDYETPWKHDRQCTYIVTLRRVRATIVVEKQWVLQASWNVMAHAQKQDFVFRRNGRVHLKRRGASVQSTTGSRGVHISGINAGYTMFRGSVKSTGYPLHSPVSPSLPLPCVTVCHHISTGVYTTWVSVSITLGIQHAMRMRHIVICGLPRCAIIFQHFILNGPIFF